MGAHRTWKWAPFCFSHLPPCASLPVPSPPLASIILSSQTWKLLPELTLWWYLRAFVLIFISAPWILIFEAGSNTFPEWRDLLEAGGGSQHQIISIIIIQRGGILLQPRGERKKKSDEFAKYMELWKHSLLSCIFTENDAVDSAPAIALPGVRWAVFNVVWL